MSPISEELSSEAKGVDATDNPEIKLIVIELPEKVLSPLTEKLGSLTLKQFKVLADTMEKCLLDLEPIGEKAKKFIKVALFAAVVQMLLFVPAVISALIGLVYHWFQPKAEPRRLLDDVFGGLKRGFLYLPSKIGTLNAGVKVDWNLTFVEPENVIASKDLLHCVLGDLGLRNVVSGNMFDVISMSRQIFYYLSNEIKIEELHLKKSSPQVHELNSPSNEQTATPSLSQASTILNERVVDNDKKSPAKADTVSINALAQIGGIAISTSNSNSSISRADSNVSGQDISTFSIKRL